MAAVRDNASTKQQLRPANKNGRRFDANFSMIFLSHQRDRRMIAGRRASIEDWKFAASLVFLQPLRRWEICTATLVDRFWLVTAAHCVDDLTRSPEYLKVKMCEWDSIILVFLLRITF